MTIRELSETYQDHAQNYYRAPNGEPTREANNVRDALRGLIAIAGTLPLVEIAPRLLRQLQSYLQTTGISRPTINARINRIRRMVRWAAEIELLPADLPAKLSIVSPLKRGRCNAPEPAGVGPVAWSDVAATLAALGTDTENTVGRGWGRLALERMQLATMIETHWWTGARPSEVCRMRKTEIDRTRDVWIYTPADHKTAHHGHTRAIPIGPSAQSALSPWWERIPGDLLFPGRPRTSPLKVNSYYQAIRRVNDRHDLTLWSPGQIRHAAATRLRKLAGLDPVRAQLGHKHASTTEIYAETDVEQAIRLMRDHG